MSTDKQKQVDVGLGVSWHNENLERTGVDP